MPRTIEKLVYQFSELSDRAKEKARDWMRACQAQDNELLDRNLDDFETVAKILGIEFSTHTVKLMSGGERWAPNIYWSGFSNQGDGLCFEGSWSLRKESIEEIKAHAPQDEKLHAIAERLWPVMLGKEFGLSATITHRGNYYHENSVDIYVSVEDDETDYEIPDTQITDALKDLMRWMYGQLEQDDEYLNSDEAIDETIEANEYEFDEDGRIT